MTEEMVGGQHHNDESDTDPGASGEHTNARSKFLKRYGTETESTNLLLRPINGIYCQKNPDRWSEQ